MLRYLKNTGFLMLGLALMGWCAVLLWRYFPMNPLVYGPLLAVMALAFGLGLWRPWLCLGLLLFTAPWLMAVPLLATSGMTHPMHVFVMLAALAGLSLHEMAEKEKVPAFFGFFGWSLWLGAVLVGIYASVSRYAPEWVIRGGDEFFRQVVNARGWTREQALNYIAFNGTQLFAGLLLLPFAYRCGVREQARLGSSLAFLRRLWLFLAAGATLAIAVAVYQRTNIEFCANRSFYWMKMGRVNGTCQDPNALGVMLCLTAITGLSFLAAWRREKGFLKPLLLLGWVAICSLGINYSGSRSAFLGLILTAFFLLLGLVVNTQIVLKARPLVRVAVCLGILGLLTAGFGFYSMTLVTKADKMLTGTTKSPALQRRLKKDLRNIRNAGQLGRILKDSRREVFPRYAGLVSEATWPGGVGVGAFVVELPNFAHYEEETLRSVDNACNFYLHVKAETGLFGSLGVFLLLFGIFGSFAIAWFKWRADSKALGEITAAFLPVPVFAILLVWGVHTEVMEVAVVWNVLLGLFLAALGLRSGNFPGLHADTRGILAFLLLLLLAADFCCCRKLNMGDLNSERRRASIGQVGEEGFRQWEDWHAQNTQWRWSGLEAMMCVQKMNDYVHFRLLSNRPDLAENPQEVAVHVNGTLMTNVVLAVPGESADISLPCAYALPFDEVTGHYVSIRLSCKNTWRPCDYGAQGDTRNLGVAMGRLRWSREAREEGGLHARETDQRGRVFAWTEKSAFFNSKSKGGKTVSLSLRALQPFLRQSPLSCAIYVNGGYLDTVHLGDRNWRNYEYILPEDIPKRVPNRIEIICSRSWEPRHYGFDDARELGVAVSLPEWQPENIQSNKYGQGGKL